MSIRIDMRSRGFVVLLFIPFVSSIHKERQMCGSELACCVGTKCNCTTVLTPATCSAFKSTAIAIACCKGMCRMHILHADVVTKIL